MDQNKVLITAALPYANAPLHFGHLAGAYLPADCFARFCRLTGEDVLFLCGSDEYGLPITLSAEKEGRSPKEHVDIFHSINKAFFEKIQISFDHYSRTTWPGHVEFVQQYFLDLKENGYIEEKTTDQLYSEEEKRFFADRYVVGTCPKCHYEKARGDECPKCSANYEATDLGSPCSKITGSPLTLKPTKHFFLRFDLFKDRLSEWIKDKPWKANVLNFSKSYIEELRPRAITRDSKWGVPIPLEGTEEKVLYVWFDAPIGYISAAKDWAIQKGDPDLWKSYWQDPATRLVHFIGKDNIPFHAVFFPAMTMGQNQPFKLVDDLPANEFLNLEGRQFSKSEGWTIDMQRFFSQFTPDQIRYYLAANAPETQDAEFGWKEFGLRCNSELLGKYGNLANRVLVFAQRHCEGKVPPLHLKEVDRTFLKSVKDLVLEIKTAYSSFHLRKATAKMMELAALGNVYFDAKKPWALAKDPKEKQAMETTVGCCLEGLKALALASSPIIPQSAQKLWEMLGFETPLADQNWSKIMKDQISTKTPLPEPKPLFTKVEDEQITKEAALLHENLPKEEIAFEPIKEEITFDVFTKLDLRVAEIIEVEAIPKSKKLLKLQVDLGFEKRQIVSGIAPYFEDIQELVGKKVAVVVNLKSAKLMGVESQGMILASGGKEAFEVLSLKEARVGDVIS